MDRREGEGRGLLLVVATLSERGELGILTTGPVQGCTRVKNEPITSLTYYGSEVLLQPPGSGGPRHILTGDSSIRVFGSFADL